MSLYCTDRRQSVSLSVRESTFCDHRLSNIVITGNKLGWHITKHNGLSFWPPSYSWPRSPIPHHILDIYNGSALEMSWPAYDPGIMWREGSYRQKVTIYTKWQATCHSRGLCPAMDRIGLVMTNNDDDIH